jgi:hypothetical protein
MKKSVKRLNLRQLKVGYNLSLLQICYKVSSTSLDYEDNYSPVRQTAFDCNWLKCLQSLATDQ